MTGMMPSSGVPATDAHNTILDPDTVNCNELWYSTTRCQPRFDPAAANAVLSELINLINCAGLAYDCTKLNNVCTAVKSLTQVASNCIMTTGTCTNYIGALDPPMTEYPTDCCFMLKITPHVSNCDGPVFLNLNGLGDREIVRNDGEPPIRGDLPAGVPALLMFCGGKWYIPYLVLSQSPVPYKGIITYWVRTDGSDVTGDGSENTPAKAFRTIDHAFAVGITDFQANADLTLDIRLGIPGSYAGCQFYRFPGTVQLTGDPAGYNFLNYKVTTKTNNQSFTCIEVDESSVVLSGVNIYMDAVSPTFGASLGLLTWRNSRCFINDCGFDNSTGGAGTNANKYFCLASSYANINLGSGNIIFDAHGQTLGGALAATSNGSVQIVGYQNDTVAVVFKDFTVIEGGYKAEINSSVGVSDAVVLGVPLSSVTISNTNGPKYKATVSSFVNGGGGKPIPGSTAGSVADYGVFHA